MSAIDVSEELLADVKNYIGKTWSDPDEDNVIRGPIRRGVAYLTDKTGVPATAFSGEGADDRAQALLYYYVLYDRAGSLAQYTRNYSSEINSLRRRHIVRAAQAAAEEASP